MLKFFKYPWAVTGTRTAIPATDPGTGEMNYQTGYPAPYQLPKTDPSSRNVERDKFNELMYDVTTELQLLQIAGVPDFITPALNGGGAYPYDVGATCNYLGRQYVSRKTANLSLPSVAADWSLVRLGGTPKAVAGGTANAVTADFVPDLGALNDGDQILIQHGAANTGAVTINPDGAGAIATYKGAGLPLVAGDIAGADYWGLYVYDASAVALQMLNPANGLLPVSLAGQCITRLVGANLVTAPLNGVLVPIGGVPRPLPAAGVSIAPTGLTVGVQVWKYLYWTGSAVAAEINTTVPVLDTTTGVMVKTGDASRTLVATAKPVTGPAFSLTAKNGGVRTWFNNTGLTLQATLGANTNQVVATWVEVSGDLRVTSLFWPGESFGASFSGQSTNSGANTNNNGIGVDVVNSPEFGANGFSAYAGSVGMPVSVGAGRTTMTSGEHFITASGYPNVGTATWTGGVTPFTCVINVRIYPPA